MFPKKTATAYQIHIYDTSGDGKVNIVDYVAIHDYLLGLKPKPKKPMIQSQIIIGTQNGEITSNVIYDNGKIGLSTKIYADKATMGTVDVKGLSIDGRSVEPDENGFLKLV